MKYYVDYDKEDVKEIDDGLPLAETVDGSTPENEEIKLPKPIYLKDSGGTIIVMEAESTTSYLKSYFKNSDGVLSNPYRNKTVKLPVNRDGKVFSNTYKLFTYLVSEGKYQRM